MKSDPPDDAITARLGLAEEIAREAGAFARRAFLERDGLTVRTKGTQDWVSNVDLEVEDLIRTRLAAAYPHDAVLGEEHGASAGTGKPGIWVVDPIDGTTCFLLGLPQWCVVLAYTIDSLPVVAAIYDPMADELYTAAAGRGAFLNGQTIRVSEAVDASEGLMSIGSAQMADPARSAAFMSDLVRDGGMYLRIGACALGLCQVAAGRLLASFEPLVSPWDDLAGMLIVREAGGRTNDFAPTLAVDRRRPVLAAAPGIWPRVAQLL